MDTLVLFLILLSSAFLYITVLILAHKHKYKHTNGGSYFQSKERDKQYDEKKSFIEDSLGTSWLGPTCGAGPTRLEGPLDGIWTSVHTEGRRREVSFFCLPCRWFILAVHP